MPPRTPLSALALLLFAGRGGAEILPTHPLRDLAIQADAVVLAEPAGAAGRFRVLETLKGSSPRPGAAVEVVDLGDYAGGVAGPGRVDRALLFLVGGGKGDGRYTLVPSGLRLHTAAAGVWWPVQPRNPGGYVLAPETDVDWGVLVDRARADCAAVGRLLAARARPPAARAAALLDWVERHRDEFAGDTAPGWQDLTPSFQGDRDRTPAGELAPRGWGELQLLPFVWALEGAAPGEAWRVVTVYAELNGGALAPGCAADFATREGRRLLLDVARDDRQLDGTRARALKLLAHAGTVPAAGRPGAPDAAERAALRDGLLALVAGKSAPRRGLAALALRRVAADPADAAPALAALTPAYRAEPPGPARNALAESVLGLGGAAAWRPLSGQPDGLLVLVNDLGRRDDKLFFWADLRSDGVRVVECPTVLIERVDGQGEVRQTKSLPLPAAPGSGSWAQGWAPGGVLYAEVAVGDLRAGNWRLRLTGRAGKDRAAWSSEPRTFQVLVPGVPGAAREKSAWDRIVGAIKGEPPMPAPPPHRPGAEERKIVLDGDSL